MIGRVLRRALLFSAFLALPMLGHAQEAVLTGTVVDSTSAVLPGVTVVAVLEATGNRFESVTDATGAYRLPVRVGVYTITAELPGFHHGDARRDPVVGRSDGGRESSDGSLERAGNHYRNG
jgi:hypothetical protein